MNMEYQKFLEAKTQGGKGDGFAPIWMPSSLFLFQQDLVEWAVRKGKAAIFADCGLGKTAIQLTWAQNIVEKTNRPVLVLTPLAVGHQTIQEGEKFGIECYRNYGVGGIFNGVNVCNYEKLHLFNPNDFAGVVCDESSILKSFDGTRRNEITQFMRKMQYRLICTATAAPNDYTELGTSSEALGHLGHMDMLMRFFKNDQNTIRPMVYRQRGNFSQLDEGAKWRFKGHAEIPFWQWVCSWARAVRRPSDLGFSDEGFILPALVERDYIVKTEQLAEGMLFPLPAVGLTEQRDERRRSIRERCEKNAGLVADTRKPFVSWCHLNDESDLLAKLIPDAVEVSGKDSDEEKEEKFLAFSSGEARGMITKPKIGAWGLNWQHCSHVTIFPSHSFEQYYQAVRRCWRFGQEHPVVVEIITTEGETSVLENLQRKAKAADRMFSALVEQMNRSQHINRSVSFTKEQEIPAWLANRN